MQEGFFDLLVNHEGRCLLRLRDRMWENGDLDRAWAHAGLGIQYVPQAMSLKQLEDWIPGSTRLWERRPLAFSTAVGTAVFVIAMVAIIAAVMLSPTAP
ncbi:MAG: hypothetical protein J7513_09730 [Solirubrobacteraceae bacterium]|nr:hypothetical protein [Solirubrobacteraceae bacterium]